MSSTQNVTIPIKGSFVGEYLLTKRKAATDEIIEQIGPFKNLITDIGLERIGTAAAIVFCYVGAGTAAASALDTQMGSYLRNTLTNISTVATSAGASPYWAENAATYRFTPLGSSQNITEVGVGWVSNSTNGLWSRARIVDGSNNPITLTILGDEYLDVTYILRYYPPLTDASYNVTISGVVYSFVTRGSNLNAAQLDLGRDMVQTFASLTAYGGPVALGPLTGTLTGATGSSTMNSGAVGAYVPASLTTTVVSSSTLAQGNVAGGITGITGTASGTLMAGCSFQSTVSPAIPKDNTKTLSLTFAFTWDRY